MNKQPTHEPRTQVHTLRATTEVAALMHAQGGTLGIAVSRNERKWREVRPCGALVAEAEARALARTLVELAVHCGFERVEVQAATVLELPTYGGMPGSASGIVGVWGAPTDARLQVFYDQSAAYIDERFGVAVIKGGAR